MKSIKNSILMSAALVPLALCLTSLPAASQEAPADEAAKVEDTITVTGSRIKRKDLTSVGPVTVLDSVQIEQTGITNLETLLQRLPSSAGFGGNSSSAYWVSNGWGTPQINLRGLGVNRTLVLLNGRRIVYGGTGANSAVDLSMIPMSLVSRVEVLKDGASATYGADAVAGVINLITKEGYDGFEASAKYGMTDEGDGEELLLDLSWGATSSKGDVMFNVSYQDTGAAPLSDESRAPCPGTPGPDGFVCDGLSSSTIGGRGTLPAGYVMPDGSVLTGPTRVNFNQMPGGDGDSFQIYDGNRDGFNYNPYFNASNPLERLSFATFGTYHLTDSTDLFAELLYTKRWSSQPASPATLVDIGFDASHPTNPTGVDFVLERRRLLENGARVFEQETDTFRIVTGLKGNLGDVWSYEASLNWGRNTGSDSILNNINTGRLAQTLDPATCGTGGVPCADLFGYGDVTQDVLDYIVFTETGLGGNEQKAISASMSGEVFQLPAGMLGVAFGAEWREDKGWRNPDSLSVAGLALGNQQDPISGSTKAKEVFAEVSVPLIKDIPLVQSLSLDGAIRYSDYDLFGSDTNYKAGLNWRINDAVKLRGTFATAFRIPNIPELFGGVSEGNLTTVDPCSGWAALSPTSNIYLNCQAAGVPTNYIQLGNTVLTDAGGNPNLEPESSESFTIGTVLQPIEGLSVTLDYFDIKIDNAIRTTPGSTKLSLCYESSNLSHQFCAPEHHTRNPLNGDVNYLSTQNANTGSETMKGLDIGVVYGFEKFGLDHSIDFNATYLSEYETVAFEGDDPTMIAGYIGGGNGGYPEWRAISSWTTTSSKWSGTYSVQMIGEGDDFYATSGPGSHIPAQFYHNAQFSYDVTEAFRVTAGVDNIFQNDPPFVASWTDGNTDTMTYDLLGRRGYIRLSYRK